MSFQFSDNLAGLANTELTMMMLHDATRASQDVSVVNTSTVADAKVRNACEMSATNKLLRTCMITISEFDSEPVDLQQVSEKQRL